MCLRRGGMLLAEGVPAMDGGGASDCVPRGELSNHSAAPLGVAECAPMPLYIASRNCISPLKGLIVP